MACCTRYCAAEAHFSKKIAEGDLENYRHRGPEAVTEIILAELRRWPLQGKRLLDVGGGIGVICAEFARDGLAGATLVEASPSYLEVARGQLELRYAPRPTQFVLGDFVLLAETLPDADAVTLDRVVCCYPDAHALLKAAAKRTREVLAFSYPCDRWYMHVVIAIENLLRRLRGSVFKVVIHSPKQMRATLEDAGMVQAARRETLTWVIEVYRRR